LRAPARSGRQRAPEASERFEARPEEDRLARYVSRQQASIREQAGCVCPNGASPHRRRNRAWTCLAGAHQAPLRGKERDCTLEEQHRAASRSSDFVPSYPPAPPAPGGSSGSLDDSTNPLVATLRHDGLSSAVTTLNFCGLVAAHVHPRASELIYEVSGTAEVAIQEEFGGRFVSAAAVREGP
jgi:hypothetical protein